MKTSLINLDVSATLVGRETSVKWTLMTVCLSPVFMEAVRTTWLVLSAIATRDMLALSVMKILMSVSIIIVNMEEPVRMDPTCTPAYAPKSTGAPTASGPILLYSVVKMLCVQMMVSAMMDCGGLTVHACQVSQAPDVKWRSMSVGLTPVEMEVPVWIDLTCLYVNARPVTVVQSVTVTKKPIYRESPGC